MINRTELQNQMVTPGQLQQRCQKCGAVIEAIEHGEKGGTGHDIADPSSRDCVACQTTPATPKDASSL